MRTWLCSTLYAICVLALSQGQAQAQNSISDFFQKMQSDLQNVLGGRAAQKTAPPQTERGSKSTIFSGDDQGYVQQAIQFSLEFTRYGEKTTWKNPNTGHNGYVIAVTSGGMRAGQLCKIYQRSVNTAYLITQYQGKACREASGQWVISYEKVVTQMAASQPSPVPEPSYVPSRSGSASSVYKPTKTTTPSMPVYGQRATVREVQQPAYRPGIRPWACGWLLGSADEQRHSSLSAGPQIGR